MFTFAGGELGLAVFFWETAKKENPDNPVNPVKYKFMER
jgi:hypothetical protein